MADVSLGSLTPRLRARATLARVIGEPATKQVVETARYSHRMISSWWSAKTGPGVASFHPRGDSAAWLRRHGIDLIVYPSPTNISYELGLPYVMAVHDLQHRIHPEFPEVSADGDGRQGKISIPTLPGPQRCCSWTQRSAAMMSWSSTVI